MHPLPLIETMPPDGYPGAGDRRRPTVPPRYTLGAELGRGGMGVVYRAFDHELGRAVALKTFRLGAAEDLHRIKQEFRACADLEHLNLVRMYDLFAQGEEAGFTMELVEGARFGAELPPTGLRRALASLLAGLRHLHAHGRVHRDIKPGNVLVGHDGRVVLLDFGLAVRLEDVTAGTRHAGASGTPGYLAPELRRGGPASPASDLYAVGALLHTVLAREAPPPDGREEPLAPGDPLLAAGDPLLAEIAVGLLHPDPERRPRLEPVLARLLGPEPTAIVGEGTTPGLTGHLVGRGVELGELDAAVARVRASRRPEVVWVRGESGIGKSTLLRAFLRGFVGNAGVLAFTGRCTPHESVPYQAVDAVVDGLAAWLEAQPDAWARVEAVPHRSSLARTFPVLRWLEDGDAPVPGGRTAAEEREDAFSALHALLRGISRDRVVVLVVDDCQWADADSLLLLRRLAAGADSGLLLVLAERSSAETSRTPGLDGGCVLSLAGLGGGEAAALARAVLGAAPAEGADTVFAGEGEVNPFFLAEHLAATLRGGVTERFTSVDALVRTRVGLLPEPHQRVLEVGCLAQEPLDVRAIDTLLPRGEDVLPVLRALVSGRLLREEVVRGRPAFAAYHDQVSEVVRSRIEQARFRGLNGAIAELFLARSADPAHIANHLLLAERRSEAVPHLLASARRAAEQLAFDRAARQYQVALDCGATDPEIGARLGDALAGAGRAAAAADAWLAAAERREPAAALSLRSRAAEALIGAGFLEEGNRVLDALLVSVGVRRRVGLLGALHTLRWVLAARLARLGARRAPRPDAAARRLLADALWIAGTCLGYYDAVASLGFQARHLVVALDAGDPALAARALALEGCSLGSFGRPSARLVTVERELGALLGEVEDPAVLGWVHLANGYRDFNTGRLFEACASFDRAQALYEAPGGSRWESTLCRTHRLFAMVYLARFGELAEHLPRLLATADATEDRVSWVYAQIGAGFALPLLHGDAPAAARLMDQARARWPGELPPTLWFVDLVNRAKIDLHAGRPDAAAARFDAASRRLSTMGVFQAVRVLAAWHQGLALVRGARWGWRERARARRLAAGLAREAGAWADAPRHLIEAGIRRRDGDGPGAAASLEAAARAFERASMPAHADAARWCAAGLSGRVTAPARDALIARGVVEPEAWVAGEIWEAT